MILFSVVTQAYAQTAFLDAPAPISCPDSAETADSIASAEAKSERCVPQVTSLTLCLHDENV
jgi:hypothetical protein